MLNQIVVYEDYYPVAYTNKGYMVKSPVCDLPLFSKNGDFSATCFGLRMCTPHKFKVVDKMPGRRPPAKK